MNESIRKRIFVIGGGISGLAALHYLKLRYQKCPEVEIVLLEKRSVPGGVIGTEMISDARFETGSNGFLNTQPLTFQLIEELGLKDQLIEAFPDNKVRFLCVKNKLYPLPANPLGLLSFPLLSAADKLALLKESFVKSKGRENETVHEFVSRRLSPGWAKMLADPMISGIYAGDAREIVLRDAFPTLAELEAEHGSLLKGLMAARKKGGGGKSLYSLSEGMGSIIHALYQKYQAHIRLNQDVDDIRKEANGQYLIRTDEQLYTADQVFLTVPAITATCTRGFGTSTSPDSTMSSSIIPTRISGGSGTRRSSCPVPTGSSSRRSTGKSPTASASPRSAGAPCIGPCAWKAGTRGACRASGRRTSTHSTGARPAGSSFRRRKRRSQAVRWTIRPAT